MNAATTSSDQSVIAGGLAPEVGEAEVDIELEQIDASGLVGHRNQGRSRHRTDTGTLGVRCLATCITALRASRPASRPEAAVEALLERGSLGLRDRLRGPVLDGLRVRRALRRARARARHRALRPRADRRLHGARRARQEAEHGGRDARPLGRDREGGRRRGGRLPSRASCSGARARRRSTRSSSSSASCASGSKAKDRAVPFGIEVMGRVRELGSIDDVVEIASRLDWVRPVIDFAHMHATSDGAFTSVEPFAAALEQADAVIPAGRAVPHPLLGHPVREPQRDEAPALRRGHAARRAAARRARALRAAGDGDLGVADARVDRRDQGDPRRVVRLGACSSRRRSRRTTSAASIRRELDEDGAYRIGRAYVEQFSPTRIAVGRDMRTSSPSMAAAVREGAADGGAERARPRARRHRDGLFRGRRARPRRRHRRHRVAQSEAVHRHEDRASRRAAGRRRVGPARRARPGRRGRLARRGRAARSARRTSGAASSTACSRSSTSRR